MGSRLTGGDFDNTYAAAALWVERALRTDGSLFTPGKAVWTSDWLGEVRRRVQDNPDVSANNFWDKLRRQLEGSAPQVYQLVGEALYVYYLAVVDTKANTKESNINKTLGWSEQSMKIPTELISSLSPGIAQFGSARVHIPFYVGFLIEFVEQWKNLGKNEHEHLLKAPFEFKGFVMDFDFRSELLKAYPNRTRVQQEALLHLVFPDTFDHVVSPNHKNEIAGAFQYYVAEGTQDVDRKLQQIRSNLEELLCPTDSNYLFYKPRIRDFWGGPTPKHSTGADINDVGRLLK